MGVSVIVSHRVTSRADRLTSLLVLTLFKLSFST